MNSIRSRRPGKTRGSAVIAALVLCLITAVIAAGVLTLAVSEKRMNRSSVLTLEARNTAESASEYVVAQVKNMLESTTDFTSTDFSGDETLHAPPNDYFANASYQINDIDVYAGMEAIDGMDQLLYLDPANTEYRNNDYAGNYAYRRRIPVATRATISAGGHTSTAHVAQYLEAYIMPLFTFSIFYGGDPGDPVDLEIFPGPQMTVYGPVHSNGDIFVRKQSSSGVNLTFMGRVSAAGGFYAKKGNQPLLYMMRHGVLDTTDYTDHVYLKHPISGASTAVRSSGGVWRDYYWNSSTETETTRNAFRDWAETVYSTNLRTRANGVDALVINGANGAAGRSFIAAPTASDSAGEKSMQLARKSGLIIVVNPDDEERSVYIPNVGSRTMDPVSYRVYTSAGREVVLPGQLYYGPSGAGRITSTLANAPVTATTDGTSQPYANAVVRLGTDVFGAGADHFYDLRRVTNGHRLSPSGTYPHTARKIRKIDIDMTNLKKAVDRSINGLNSSTVYKTTVPESATWTNSIFNASGTPTSETLTDAHAIFDANGGTPIGSNWFWNGGIYVLSVDAEEKDADTVEIPDRHDSGVRLVNGRGRIASKDEQGLTIATNDVLYIMGHYNADGTIHTGATTTSARFPEVDDEAPTAIMADAIVVLSQPIFENNGSGHYVQTRGWNDAYSKHRIDTYTSYSTSWGTSAPSTSNRIDGINTSSRPGRLPWWTTADASLGSTNSSKLVPYSTEISAAFLTGIVRSNTTTGAYSGGVHNYPRLLEDWYTSSAGSANTLAIRGSMVAFFFSAVGTEPWSLRFYQAPIRLWGLNEDYIRGILPPLTPNTIAIQQLNFRLVTASEFETITAAISHLSD
ncbi:MAG: hypothetical protein IAE82_09015 [Opitutaceae bacterium]|nr:hypothetical protein [Opitutaceae bacterium]